MHGYAFNIGDLLRIKPGTIDYITTPADPDKHYTHSLRVVFQFWDGKQNVYVVTAEDGITMFIIEDNAELQEAAPEEAQAPDTVNSRLLDEEDITEGGENQGGAGNNNPPSGELEG